MNHKQSMHKAVGRNIYEIKENGKLQLVAVGALPSDASRVVWRLNDLTEIVNSGLGIDDVK